MKIQIKSKHKIKKSKRNCSKFKTSNRGFNINKSENLLPSSSEMILAKHVQRKLRKSNAVKTNKKYKKRKLLIEKPMEIIENEELADTSFLNTVECLFDNEQANISDEFNFSGNVCSLFGETSNICNLSIKDVTRNNLEMIKSNIQRNDIHNPYVIDVKEGKLLLVKENSTVYLHGVIQLTVLMGSVEILGNALDQNSTCDVYSPRGTSFLYISTLPSKNKFTQLEYSNIDQMVINQFLRRMSDNDALLLCKNLSNPLVSCLKKYVPQQLFPKSKTGFNILNDTKDINVINISPSWENLNNSIKIDSRILLSGGKGVGKSTLLRYLVNNLLRKYKKILVIDLDPGQSEFTVPGCVSSVIVTKPLLGPNYTHLQKPEKCFYVPNISVLHAPREFIESIKMLLKYYDNFSNCPTIINCMGYTRILGPELLSSIIAITNPSLIFQINSKNSSKNCNIHFDLIEMQEKVKFFTPELNISNNFIVKKVDSPSDKCVGWECRPRQLREMCIFSYFSQLLNESLCITDESVPIYKISLSRINILTPKNISYSEAVANANIVALCSKAKCNNSADVYECHGWGIIRAINLEKDLLYLITPLDQHDLKHVTFLIVGSVKMPPALYIMTNATGTIPYVSSGFVTPFSEIPKRAYIPKK